MELDKSRIEDAIVREVADGIIGEEELRDRVRRAVDKRIDALFVATADAQIRVAIEAAIKDGFDHEYTRVNTFGERQGKPTSIRAELERLVAGYWNEKVDKRGKVASGYGADITRAEWTMMQIVAESFNGDMKQHVVNLGGALKDKLRVELYGTINRLLSDVFRVNSMDDKKAGSRGPNSIAPEQTGSS